MTELLKLENVHITMKRDCIPIVKEVNLSVHGGKTTVIVGESGSGKTMLIKAVAGVLNRGHLLITGRADFKGVDLLALNQKERRRYCTQMALIMQNPMTAFDPSVKIGKQMTIGMRASKSEIHQKSVQAIQAVGLSRAEQLLKAYPHELSGGMLQRVMVAIAMMSQASVIVADEPTTALDVVSKGIVLDQLSMRKDNGAGILLVTHDFVVARKIADYIIVMKNGEFIESGDTETVLHTPQHDYTKALLEASILCKREIELC